MAKTKNDLEKELKEKNEEIDNIKNKHENEINELKKMFEDLKRSVNANKKSENKSKKELDYEEVEVLNNTFSIGSYKSADGTLLLNFDKFGQSDFIRFEDLKKLLKDRKNRAIFEEGSILVLDDWAVKELRLDKAYEKNNVDKNLYENLLDKTAENMINELPKLTKRQKIDFYKFFVDRVVEDDRRINIAKKSSIQSYYKDDIDFAIELALQRKQSQI